MTKFSIRFCDCGSTETEPAGKATRCKKCRGIVDIPSHDKNEKVINYGRIDIALSAIKQLAQKDESGILDREYNTVVTILRGWQERLKRKIEEKKQ